MDCGLLHQHLFWILENRHVPWLDSLSFVHNSGNSGLAVGWPAIVIIMGWINGIYVGVEDVANIYICVERFMITDVSTDGKWCYLVFWVVPHSRLLVRWSNLKNRLLSVCPSCSVSFYLNHQPPPSTSSPVFLLKFFCLDRKGLLHGNLNSLLLAAVLGLFYECLCV